MRLSDEQLEPIDEQARLLAQRHRRAPLLPAILGLAGIERGAEHTDGYAPPHLIQ
jgi:hypothetical protein